MSKMRVITEPTKIEAARYLVKELKDAGGCLTFGKFYDGSSKAAKLLRVGLKIDDSDARWLIPEVVLNAVIGDLQQTGDVAIVKYPRKKLVNGQPDFKISLTPQGRQAFQEKTIPSLQESTIEIPDGIPYPSRLQKKQQFGPKRSFRVFVSALRKGLEAWCLEQRRQSEELHGELENLQKLPRDLPDVQDYDAFRACGEIIQNYGQWLAEYPTRMKQLKAEGEKSRRIMNMLDRLPQVPKSTTISGSYAERLLDGAAQADWGYVQAIQRDLIASGPPETSKAISKLQDDDWAGAFLALADMKAVNS